MNINYLRSDSEETNKIAHGWLDLFDESMWDQFLTVLDVGCGNGQQSQWWGTRRPWNAKEEFAPFTQCKAVDLFEPHTDYNTNFEFTKCDYHKLPYKEGTFDIVWSNYSLQYSNNPRIALWEWRRVLKPDGRLFLTVPSHDYYFRNKVHHQIQHNWGCYFTLSSLIYMLALSGYDPSKGYFYKSKKEPFIRADVPVNTRVKMPLNNLEVSLYDLQEMNLLPSTVSDKVTKSGMIRDEDFVTAWVTGLLRDYRSDY